MSFLDALPGIVKKGNEQYQQAGSGEFTTKITCGGENFLAQGDNLSWMKFLLEQRHLAGQIRCIYADPPFFSGASYQGSFRLAPGTPLIHIRAYDDRWNAGLEQYLTMLVPRIRMMRDLLAEDGLLWMHLDWHVAHYVRVLLDDCFGSAQFVNEIIWQYKSGGSSKRHFARKHDTILLYSKTDQYQLHIGKEKSYNRGFRPYRFQGVKEYQDDVGWYTMVNQKDVWTMDMIGRTSRERTGYATQKPQALLRRIVASSTRPGDLCADFFAGSGSLAAAASALGRRWICCDQGKLATGLMQQRFLKEKIPYDVLSDHLLFQTSAGVDFTAAVTLRGRTPAEGVCVALQEVFFDAGVLAASDAAEQQLLKDLSALHLVLFWSVDLEFDGCRHRVCAVAERSAEGVPPRVLCPKEPAGMRLSICLVDVFGNHLQKVFIFDGVCYNLDD